MKLVIYYLPRDKGRPIKGYTTHAMEIDGHVSLKCLKVNNIIITNITINFFL